MYENSSAAYMPKPNIDRLGLIIIIIITHVPNSITDTSLPRDELADMYRTY